MGGSQWLVATGVATAVTFLAGLPLRRSAEPAFSRMCGVFWLLSSGLAPWFFGLLIDVVLNVTAPRSLFWVGIAGAVYGSVLVASRSGALQQIGLYIAGFSAAVGFGLTFGPDWDLFLGGGPSWLAGSIFVLGAVWLAAIALRALLPTRTALFLGSSTVLLAPVLAIGDLKDPAPFVGLACAVAFLVDSVVLRQTVLLISGASVCSGI